MKSENNSFTRYPFQIRVLHWLMAACFFFMWACGYAMTSFVEDDSPLQETLFGLHISMGVTLLALMVLRIAFRFTSRIPQLPQELAQWEKIGSHLGHIALYLLPVIVITIGWAETDFGGHGVEWFGVSMPKVFPSIETLWGFNLEETTATLHLWFAYTMLVIAIIHIAAVVKHRWFDGHDVLQRMSFGSSADNNAKNSTKSK